MDHLGAILRAIPFVHTLRVTFVDMHSPCIYRMVLGLLTQHIRHLQFRIERDEDYNDAFNLPLGELSDMLVNSLRRCHDLRTLVIKAPKWVTPLTNPDPFSSIDRFVASEDAWLSCPHFERYICEYNQRSFQPRILPYVNV
jgi:hypothetical protein